MKVLFVGDNHIDGKTPQNRTDNYMEATLRKLEECMQIAEDRKADAVVFLGDVFNHREVSPLARNGALKILKSQSDEKSWSFPSYVVVGNHDIQSSHPLENSSLGTLIESGVLIKLDYEPNLGIAFGHFTNDLDNEIREGKLTTNSAIIWACHASITDRPSRFSEHSILFDSVAVHPNNVLVICGHIHYPMEMIREDGKWFVNPGAIGRMAASKDNFERDLKVFWLEYELDGKIIDKRYIPLKTAENYKNIFRLEEIEVIKAEKKEVQEFIKKVSLIRAHNWNYTTLDDKLMALKNYGTENKIHDKTIDIAMEAVKSVNEEQK
jgi:DNA repair exonuclease SbcCD nuclease subunit